MKNHRKFMKDNITVPICNFTKKYCTKYSLFHGCQNVANFIYDHSKETAIIMLVFNAISIVSSHIAQINGLKKSERKNKNYLITQEWGELGLNLMFTIVPPFLLNSYMTKKFDSGQWTTKSAQKSLINEITPSVGVLKEELYSIDHIRPLKETLSDTKDCLIRFIKTTKLLPTKLKEKIKAPPIKIVRNMPRPPLDKITADFDLFAAGKKHPKFYNGKAYDEICGQRNGLLMLSTIGYLIVASNIIMPILKNKLSNYFYKKQLIKQGETPESIRRKKRFAHINYKPNTNDKSEIFSDFSFQVGKLKSIKKPTEIQKYVTTNKVYYNNNLKI